MEKLIPFFPLEDFDPRNFILDMDNPIYFLPAKIDGFSNYSLCYLFFRCYQSSKFWFLPSCFICCKIASIVYSLEHKACDG